MSEYLEVKPKTVWFIEGWESADLSQFDDLSAWRFWTENTGAYSSNELYAEYIGSEENAPDEIVYVWYSSRNERYWGVVKMNPNKFEVRGDLWYGKDEGK